MDSSSCRPSAPETAAREQRQQPRCHTHMRKSTGSCHRNPSARVRQLITPSSQRSADGFQEAGRSEPSPIWGNSPKRPGRYAVARASASQGDFDSRNPEARRASAALARERGVRLPETSTALAAETRLELDEYHSRAFRTDLVGRGLEAGLLETELLGFSGHRQRHLKRRRAEEAATAGDPRPGGLGVDLDPHVPRWEGAGAVRPHRARVDSRFRGRAVDAVEGAGARANSKKEITAIVVTTRAAPIAHKAERRRNAARTFAPPGFEDRGPVSPGNSSDRPRSPG